MAMWGSARGVGVQNEGSEPGRQLSILMRAAVLSDAMCFVVHLHGATVEPDVAMFLQPVFQDVDDVSPSNDEGLRQCEIVRPALLGGAASRVCKLGEPLAESPVALVRAIRSRLGKREDFVPRHFALGAKLARAFLSRIKADGAGGDVSGYV